MGKQTQFVVQQLTGFTEKGIRRLSLEVHAELVSAPSEGGTPVDTGWARANWIPSIGAANGALAGTRQAAERGSINLSMAQRGLALIATRYRLKQGPVFISNGVPYITELNDGSSAQAPAGFVQSAILRAIGTTVRELRVV